MVRLETEPTGPGTETGFKRGLKSSRVPRGTRCGYKPHLPGLGEEDPVRLQTEPTGPGGGGSGAVRNRTYRVGVKWARRNELRYYEPECY